jgi:hypothetical protein
VRHIKVSSLRAGQKQTGGSGFKRAAESAGDPVMLLGGGPRRYRSVAVIRLFPIAAFTPDCWV